MPLTPHERRRGLTLWLVMIFHLLCKHVDDQVRNPSALLQMEVWIDMIGRMESLSPKPSGIIRFWGDQIRSLVVGCSTVQYASQAIVNDI